MEEEEKTKKDHPRMCGAGYEGARDVTIPSSSIINPRPFRPLLPSGRQTHVPSLASLPLSPSLSPGWRYGMDFSFFQWK